MFGEILREHRTKAQLSQDKLAEMLGVSQQAVGLWERNKNMPSKKILLKLSEIFNVSTDYLLGNIVIEEKDVPPEETKKIHKGSLMELCEKDIFKDRQDIVEILKGGQVHDIYDKDMDKKTLADLTPEDKAMIRSGVLMLLKAAGLIEK